MCFGTAMFDPSSKTCLLCDEHHRCRESRLRFLSVIGDKSGVRKILSSKAKRPERTIPVIDESLPVMTRKKLLALYKRGFNYKVGQRQNPFTQEDPTSYSVIFGHLTKRKSLSKADIRNAIMDELGWSYSSAKVEVSRVIQVMVTVGIAKEVENFLIFLN